VRCGCGAVRFTRYVHYQQSMVIQSVSAVGGVALSMATGGGAAPILSAGVGGKGAGGVGASAVGKVGRVVAIMAMLKILSSTVSGLQERIQDEAYSTIRISLSDRIIKHVLSQDLEDIESNSKRTCNDTCPNGLLHLAQHDDQLRWRSSSRSVLFHTGPKHANVACPLLHGLNWPTSLQCALHGGLLARVSHLPIAASVVKGQFSLRTVVVPSVQGANHVVAAPIFIQCTITISFPSSPSPLP
jgi:hypothetical protein